jgi:transcriptional regulator with XRE-family HTH domain
VQFNDVDMSSSNVLEYRLLSLGARLGDLIRSERIRRQIRQAALAEKAGVSRSLLVWVEAGHVPSLETYGRLADALGLRLEIDLVDPRRSKQVRAQDPVHAAIGEWLVRLLRPLRYSIAIDEPYQHYQFAGRADVIAWRLDPPTLLHVENRTRFPNIQEAFGSYNAKRRYLPGVLAQRLGLPRGFRSVTNVLCVLRSAEALHELRLRTGSFAAVCPDPIDPFTKWLSSAPPDSGLFSVLAIVDPLAEGRTRAIVGLDEVRTIRPRYRGYADAAEALRRAGLRPLPDDR